MSNPTKKLGKIGISQTASKGTTSLNITFNSLRILKLIIHIKMLM